MNKFKEKYEELADMIRYRLYLQKIYDEGEIQVSGPGKIKGVDDWLEREVDYKNYAVVKKDELIKYAGLIVANQLMGEEDA